jgi:GxxExxY protein
MIERSGRTLRDQSNQRESEGAGAGQQPTTLRHLPARWNDVTGRIIGAAVEVHATLGPGLLESLYEQAMDIELRSAGLVFERQKAIRLNYKGSPIGDLRLDLVVENLVIVELKAIASVAEVHKAQLLSYLRSTDLPLGLLFNFNTLRLTQSMCRIINPSCSLLNQLPLASPLITSDCSDPSDFPLEDEE